jgi:hypothetical protein
MAKLPPVPIEKLKNYPTMTSWFRPDLLGKLLWRVVVSDLFGQYADRRLIVAALDPVTPDELFERAQQFLPSNQPKVPSPFNPDQDGAVWIDFVADLGDGFDATFAIASLLSQQQLTVDGQTLPRGQLLVMGGDEVYPHASPEHYTRRMLHPYGWAFPDPEPHLLDGPPVYAIPGNHDWYDGLVLFLAFFTRRSRHLHLGGWRTWQRRSYFALQLTERWWIWAMDAQLDDDVDQPQKDYFDAIAKRMPEGSNIILCGPEPGWLYTLKAGSKSLSVVDNIGWSALNAHRGLNVPVVLSGDTHHYSRYSGDDGMTQFITSGGGGAFLHSTHQLYDKVDLDREAEGITWLGGQVKSISMTTDASIPHKENGKEACYPSKAESVDMLSGNFKFVALNPGFCVLLGVIYWLAGLLTLRWWPDAAVITPLLFGVGFWAYTRNQEGSSSKVTLVSCVNGIVHGAVAIGLAHLFARLDAGLPDFGGWHIPPAAIFAAEMTLAGGLIGGFLFGLYLYASSRWLQLNHNDAFSSMRLDSHRNFLRMRIKGDELTIFAIGLDRVPTRREWRLNTEKIGSPAPAYIPSTPLQPHLIEDPIVVVCPKPGAGAAARPEAAQGVDPTAGR